MTSELRKMANELAALSWPDSCDEFSPFLACNPTLKRILQSESIMRETPARQLLVLMYTSVISQPLPPLGETSAERKVVLNGIDYILDYLEQASPSKDVSKMHIDLRIVLNMCLWKWGCNLDQKMHKAQKSALNNAQ